jgi:hypothetical protein
MQNFSQDAYQHPGMWTRPQGQLHKLVVTNLPEDITEGEVERIFANYECCKVTIKRYDVFAADLPSNHIMQYASALVFFTRLDQGKSWV